MTPSFSIGKNDDLSIFNLMLIVSVPSNAETQLNSLIFILVEKGIISEEEWENGKKSGYEILEKVMK